MHSILCTDNRLNALYKMHQTFEGPSPQPTRHYRFIFYFLADKIVCFQIVVPCHYGEDHRTLRMTLHNNRQVKG